MLREAMDNATEMGVRIKPIYDAGDLVPDDQMIELIRERLSVSDTAEGFILDGFPRTVAQAEALDRGLEEIDRSASRPFCSSRFPTSSPSSGSTCA